MICYTDASERIIFVENGSGKGVDLAVDYSDPMWEHYVSLIDAPYLYEPPVEIPQSVSRFQARAALMDAGLLADVELSMATATPIVQLAWAEATEWRRDSPTINFIGETFNLSQSDIDELFINASKIFA